jgi:hypothetical protein
MEPSRLITGSGELPANQRATDRMAKEQLAKAIISFVVILLALSAIGYLFFPSAMLSIVGITSNSQMDFLVRTLAAAFVAMIPSAWSARNSGSRSLYPSVVFGLALYMFVSSAVDLQAFLTRLVNGAAIPSIVVRVLLGGVLLWLMARP